MTRHTAMQQTTAPGRQAPIIRRLDLTLPAEADALRALYVLSLQHNAQGFVQDINFHGDIALRAEQYQKNSGEMLGVFDAETDVLIGFGGLRPGKGGPDAGRVELCNLHLHPAQQGQGIGKALSRLLLDRAHALGYQFVELHVTATQQAAIGLYKRLGFSETHRCVYEIEGISYDTVFMELPLALPEAR